MKNLSLLVLLSLINQAQLFNRAAYASNVYSVTMQNDPAVKTYKALIGETCEKMTDGGCMIYTYGILNFSLDSVIVSYHVVASCVPKERENNYNKLTNKTYKWSIGEDVVDIEGFKDFGKLTLQNSKLMGENNIEFREELK